MPHSDARSALEAAPGVPENHPLSSLETQLTIDEATKAVRIEDLGRAGVRNLRVLSQSRLTDIIQDLVETRLRDEPLCGAATARSVEEIRAQYEARWQEFRAQFDSKLKGIERALEMVRRRRALQP